MQLRAINEGDEVECNVRGRKFTAVVEEKLSDRRGLRVTPLIRNITYFHVTASQVEKIIRRERK